MQDEAGRAIAAWYIRFDLLAATMSGNRAKLSGEWISTYQQYCRRQSRDRPHDLSATFEELTSILMQLTTDSISLMLVNEEEPISNDKSRTGAMALIRKYENNALTDFGDPSLSYDGNGETPFIMRYLMLDCLVMLLMLRYQVAIAQQREPTLETEALAVKICKLTEEIECSQDGTSEALLGCATSLALAGVFFPRYEKVIDWYRRKCANVEQFG